jgi:hypothetical protein
MMRSQASESCEWTRTYSANIYPYKHNLRQDLLSTRKLMCPRNVPNSLLAMKGLGVPMQGYVKEQLAKSIEWKEDWRQLLHCIKKP